MASFDNSWLHNIMMNTNCNWSGDAFNVCFMFGRDLNVKGELLVV